MTVNAVYKRYDGRVLKEHSGPLQQHYGNVSVCSCCGTNIVTKEWPMKSEAGLPGICITDEPGLITVDVPDVSHHVVETPAGTLYISIREDFGNYPSEAGGEDEYEDEEW